MQQQQKQQQQQQNNNKDTLYGQIEFMLKQVVYIITTVISRLHFVTLVDNIAIMRL
jgi:hypothetical protein